MDYSFEKFQMNAITKFLSLDDYNYLRKELYNVDVSSDTKFQKKFDAFYRVRRDETWRENFYNYFEKIKRDENINFENIITYLYEKTGNVEPSFSSKMLATINPNMPIWDQYVLKNLNLSIKDAKGKDKLKNRIEVYEKIQEGEKRLLEEDKNIQQTIKDFKENFPKSGLSDMKILDYILWSMR